MADEIHIHEGEEETPVVPIEVHVDTPDAPVHDHTDKIIEHSEHLERHDHEISELREKLFTLPGVTVDEANAIAEEVVEEAKEELREEAEVADDEPEPEPEHHEDDEPKREHPFFRKIGN